jgi:hypothetical protein
VGPRAVLDAVEEKDSQPLPGLEPPIIQPVVQSYTTELWKMYVFEIGAQLFTLVTYENSSKVFLGMNSDISDSCYIKFE